MRAGPRETARYPPGRGRKAGGDPHCRGKDAGGGAPRAGGCARRRFSKRGPAKAIGTVFEADPAGQPDPQLLEYQYVKALPQIAAEAPRTRSGHPATFQRELGQIGRQRGQGREVARERAVLRLRRARTQPALQRHTRGGARQKRPDDTDIGADACRDEPAGYST